MEVLNHHYEDYHSKVIRCQKLIRGFLVRRNLLRQAKRNANERHAFLNQIHSNGKRTLEKLVSLPKVGHTRDHLFEGILSGFSKASSKSIKQAAPKPPDNQGRLGHFIKKRSKGQRKSTDEAIQMNEQEHDDMLKVAKVSLIIQSKSKIHRCTH